VRRFGDDRLRVDSFADRFRLSPISNLVPFVLFRGSSTFHN